MVSASSPTTLRGGLPASLSGQLSRVFSGGMSPATYFRPTTLEMFERGDFLSTYLNGEPRYDKPILVYWLQAAAVALAGPNEWAFRLPSALCATLWAWFTYLFARRHYGSERAAFAAALLASSFGVFIIG